MYNNHSDIPTELIADIYSQGHNGHAVGVRLGMSGNSVLRRLRKAGIKIRRRPSKDYSCKKCGKSTKQSENRAKGLCANCNSSLWMKRNPEKVILYSIRTGFRKKLSNTEVFGGWPDQWLNYNGEWRPVEDKTAGDKFHGTQVLNHQIFSQIGRPVLIRWFPKGRKYKSLVFESIFAFETYLQSRVGGSRGL